MFEREALGPDMWVEDVQDYEVQDTGGHLHRVTTTLIVSDTKTWVLSEGELNLHC